MRFSARCLPFRRFDAMSPFLRHDYAILFLSDGADMRATMLDYDMSLLSLFRH